jgi:hypothetical protein
VALAQKPICIITSTGMVCLSSPLKRHHPGDRECVVAEPKGREAARIGRIHDALKAKRLGLSHSKRDVIEKVVELLLAANVGQKTPFVIVRG